VRIQDAECRRQDSGSRLGSINTGVEIQDSGFKAQDSKTGVVCGP